MKPMTIVFLTVLSLLVYTFFEKRKDFESFASSFKSKSVEDRIERPDYQAYTKPEGEKK